MDFLKTLLAYMAATFVVAVESTSTPAVTPVPTPAPANIAAPGIVEMITEVPTMEITATPTVSVTPVPVPTITPNMKGYHNLLQGDRGDEVRKLQERLIELGYLPEGSADGAFGGKTRNAVRQFQYYNGLTVDGIAGRTTQTNLFENPDAAPKPTPEPTPTPTAEPAPTPVFTPAAEQEAEPAAEETRSEAADDEAMKTGNSGKTAGEQGTPETGRSQAEDTAEPEHNTDEPEPTETPEPTVTPYVVAAPTEVPWGDAITSAAEQKTEETATLNTEAAAAQTEKTDEVTEQASAQDTEGKPARETEEKADQNAEAESVQDEQKKTGETEGEPGRAEDVTGETEETTGQKAEEEAQQAAEIIEEVDLDAEETVPPTPEIMAEPEKIEYEGLAGWVILNDSETALQWTETEKDTPVVRSPRMERKDDDYRISLDDIVKSIEEWVLHDEPDSLILEAQGYTLALLNEKNGFAAMVDGAEIETDMNDFSFEEGHFIRVDFLTRALEGSWEWDADEETLMIRIPEKGEGDIYP